MTQRLFSQLMINLWDSC